MIDEMNTSNHLNYLENAASNVSKNIPAGFDEYCVAQTLSSWKETEDEKSKSVKDSSSAMDFVSNSQKKAYLIKTDPSIYLGRNPSSPINLAHLTQTSSTEGSDSHYHSNSVSPINVCETVNESIGTQFTDSITDPNASFKFTQNSEQSSPKSKTLNLKKKKMKKIIPSTSTNNEAFSQDNFQSHHLNNPLSINTNFPVNDGHLRISEQATFSSFMEFTSAFEQWKEKYFHPFRVASSEELHCGSFSEIFKYRYIVYHCAHYGTPRMRGNGKRPNQSYLPCGCKASLRINYNHSDRVLRITTLKTDHIGHNISAEDYRKIASKVRKRSPKINGLSPDSDLSQSSPSTTIKSSLSSPMETVSLSQQEFSSITAQSPNNAHVSMPILPPTSQNSLVNVNATTFKKEIRPQILYINKNSPLISPSIATSADLQMAQLPTQVQTTTTISNAVMTNSPNNGNFENKLRINNLDMSTQQNNNNLTTQMNNTLNTSTTLATNSLPSSNNLSNLLLNNPQAIAILMNSSFQQQNRNTNLQNSILKDDSPQQQTSTQQLSANSNGLLTNNSTQLQNMNLLPIIQGLLTTSTSQQNISNSSSLLAQLTQQQSVNTSNLTTTDELAKLLATMAATSTTSANNLGTLGNQQQNTANNSLSFMTPCNNNNQRQQNLHALISNQLSQLVNNHQQLQLMQQNGLETKLPQQSNIGVNNNNGYGVLPDSTSFHGNNPPSAFSMNKSFNSGKIDFNNLLFQNSTNLRNFDKTINNNNMLLETYAVYKDTEFMIDSLRDQLKKTNNIFDLNSRLRQFLGSISD